VLLDSTDGEAGRSYAAARNTGFPTQFYFQNYRIDHRATRFVLLHRDDVRTNLPMSSGLNSFCLIMGFGRWAEN
jgi:hypothetical protein